MAIRLESGKNTLFYSPAMYDDKLLYFNHILSLRFYGNNSRWKSTLLYSPAMYDEKLNTYKAIIIPGDHFTSFR